MRDFSRLLLYVMDLGASADSFFRSKLSCYLDTIINHVNVTNSTLAQSVRVCVFFSWAVENGQLSFFRHINVSCQGASINI